MGCDDVINQINEIRRMFQSTHPHGVRLVHQGFPGFFACFNPRTRTGCDLPENICGYNVRVSIHAPARGATKRLCHFGQRQSVSIHAPARGATQTVDGADYYLQFQSTHPHGVRLYRPEYYKTEGKFQSTHPHGVRLIRS